jgi:hypothetical protein
MSIECTARGQGQRPALGCSVLSDGSSISMGAPQFDPFWRRCEEAGVSVMMHNADSGYDRYATDWEPGRDEFQGFNQTVKVPGGYALRAGCIDGTVQR